MDNNLMITQQPQINLIDSVDLDQIEATMRKVSTYQAIIQKSLKKDHDYGDIAGSKPTLFKPGGEKICMLFTLNPEYDFLDKTEDYKDGFFAYNIKCTLFRNGYPVSQGVGNCNSMEKKYRYINVDTVPEGLDPATVEQITNSYGRIKYKIPNPHIADLVNTILKMAKKRAFIDAVLQVASLSDVFTQDLEDMRDFMEKEQTENIDSNSAGNIKINFGKYKGKTIEQLHKEDPKYLTWLKENAKDAVIKKACETFMDSLKDAETKSKDDTPKTDFKGTPFEEKTFIEYPEDEDIHY